MQVEYRCAALVGDRVLPCLVGEQCEHADPGDRPVGDSDGDNAVQCFPVELMQFAPRD